MFKIPHSCIIIVVLYLFTSYTASAQTRRFPTRKNKSEKSAEHAPQDSAKRTASAAAKKGPKPFDAFIKKDANVQPGLFNLYHQEEKYYFELADSLQHRDILVVNRISKSGTDLRSGMTGYAGDQINKNVIRFEKGPNNKVFIRKISYSERSADSTQAMYQAVMNSNIQPIAASFDVVAYTKDSSGVIFDMTKFIEGDNDVFFFDPRYKRSLRLGGLQNDKSYINTINSYPQNTEIATVKTYMKMPPQGASGAQADQLAGGTATLELNTSLVLLPKTPMRGRHFDPRVGYFSVRYTDFDINPQGVKQEALITRWRLEPREEDMEKYLRGELVEPKKQIVYYIDPATPEKWVPYLIEGVNDWQKAFEQAGFKNAIVGKRAPTPAEDSTWSLEDARYSAIVYKPSDIPNASGPNVHDPRSGEIIESHINWYHNVMYLLRNWYFVQASPNDERARKMVFDDALMGELIRFVSSHEVGHTLGLRHNFGSSSAYPVEKLRDPEWVKEHGHAASIMDYARFNYVAQPGDGITGAALYPKINYYDKWAIEWGYKLIPNASSSQDERKTLHDWILSKAHDPKYWFGTESNPNDPRSQNEDLGDDAMLASSYGIKNLQYIMPNLQNWTKQEYKNYDNFGLMYGEVVTQFGRYAGHVAKNIGGIYETPKTIEQQGAVYEPVSKNKQQRAMQYLNTQVFKTPNWLIDYEVADLSGKDPVDVIGRVQKASLGRLLSSRTLTNLVNYEARNGSKAYRVQEFFSELQRGIWTELNSKAKIDVFRRNLQRAYVDQLVDLLSPENSLATLMIRIGGQDAPDPTKSDLTAIARGQLVRLQGQIKAAIPGTADSLSKYHLQELADRIQQALNPKG